MMPGEFRPPAEALGECQRELQVRQRCYGRWVSEGKLTGMDAKDRMERLEAAVEYLSRLSDLQPEADDFMDRLRARNAAKTTDDGVAQGG